MKVLVIDVGGTHIKVHLVGRGALHLDSGPDLTAQAMVALVKAATAGWVYDVVTIGYPGPVVAGHPSAEPMNLGQGWMAADFTAAFGKPVKIVNDAAMQALGSYRGGRMVFLGLGTGLGSAGIFDGVLQPFELAHLPYRRGRTYEDYLGSRGLERRGRKKWERAVHDVVRRFRAALLPDYIVIGGGNAQRLKSVPEHAVLGANTNAFIGGERVWAPAGAVPWTTDGPKAERKDASPGGSLPL